MPPLHNNYRHHDLRTQGDCDGGDDNNHNSNRDDALRTQLAATEAARTTLTTTSDQSLSVAPSEATNHLSLTTDTTNNDPPSSVPSRSADVRTLPGRTSVTTATTTTATTTTLPSRTADHHSVVVRPAASDNPVRTLVHNWLVWGIAVPALSVAGWTWLTSSSTSASWWWDGWSVSTIVLTALATPVLAIVQGSLGILQFRVRFGAAPVPVTPAHGVVYVTPDDNDGDDYECLQNGEATTTTSTAAASRPPQTLDEAAQFVSPVRLLVIGDSLAIGVGQRNSSTPILPQVIAQTLSRKLHRVVYWTCHGAPGASTGWIVRELERGVVVTSSGTDDIADNDAGSSTDTVLSHQPSKASPYEQSNIEGQISRQSSSCQETTDLSEDAATVWRNRLTSHSRRFNPELLGPYDIVVVLTGSNDLKSAFFPFLLTGEDAEFRRQAQERGGSYTQELRLLLETLYEKMSVQIQTFRDQVLTQVEAATESVRERVEAATESVRERVEETMERIAPGRSFEQLFGRPKADGDDDDRVDGAPGNDVDRRQVIRKAALLEPCDSNNTVTDESDDDESDTASVQQGNSRHFPLVVLPGMPSRALPIFQTVPLRWLSCPIVDIMDQHKQELAHLHPGRVLFVPAPPLPHVYEYEAHRGEYWKERGDEDVALCLRDPPRRPHDQRLERAMQEYYATHKSWTWWKQSALFAEDQIHPNDEGYDFWGRYIAHAIVDEWKEKD